MSYSIVIVGLGNPGEEYENTRHSVGRIALDHFRTAQEFSEWEYNKKFKALISQKKIKKEDVCLVLPETFMNKSGTSVVSLIKNKKQVERLVVIHDDLDIPIGSFKISFNRGSGGHKGVESIRRALKTEAFTRIRIGISQTTPSGKLKKPTGASHVDTFILGIFKPKERELLKQVARRVEGALMTTITEGKERAMNEYN